MLKLDHLTIIAPSLHEGVEHVRTCLGLDVPFGTRHTYMGTHNHRLQLGGGVYLEIIAADPDGDTPQKARWFGLDNAAQIRADWDRGQRLRGYVASTEAMANMLTMFPDIFGEERSLPPSAPEFGFAIPKDGSLPLNGAAPSLIDHRGVPTAMEDIPDLGARLVDFTLTHPDLNALTQLYDKLALDRPPRLNDGSELCLMAEIETPSGRRQLR